MSERNAVHRGFDRFGKDAGGEKKSGGWYWRSDEVVAVVDLQKSQYGPKYYVNVAFWLRAAGDEPFPKTWKSHIRMHALLTAATVPFVERGSSLDGLRSMVDDGTLKGWLLTVHAQKKLGIAG
jgi:hypothetical protein